MALILNIETSSVLCSVSFSKNGELLDCRETVDNNQHASLLTVFIQEMLIKNKLQLKQLDAIAISKGPGSYTGLRIGTSVAKGLCYTLNIPLIAINTLEIIAHIGQKNCGKIEKDTLFCPMIDARRMDVYYKIFDHKLKSLTNTAFGSVDEKFLAQFLEAHQIAFFGNGVEKYKTVAKHSNALFPPPTPISAKHIVSLSHKIYQKKKFENIVYFQPFYLRNFIPTTPKKTL